MGQADQAKPGSCLTCRFFDRASGSGLCHRNPPQYHSDYRFPAFPIVTEEQWCGEYEAKAVPMKRTLSLKR